MFDAFEGYKEEWPGVYVPPEHHERKRITEVKIVDELLRREKFTPDFKLRRREEDILVFVYDEFRIRGKMNPILSESKYLGYAISCSELYTLRGHTMPVLLDATSKSQLSKGKIKGEVYAVPPETLLRLDKCKYNMNLFKRHKRSFFLNDQSYKAKDGTKKRPSITAWVYIGIPDVWENDALPFHPTFAHAGFKDQKYYEFFPTDARIAESRRAYPNNDYDYNNIPWHGM